MAMNKVNPKQNFPKLENEILKFWDVNKIFEESILKKSENNTFSFYDGPPFATGKPHYGHILAGTIKDVIPRFKAMQGYRVERIWGWDTHGLPIENIVEQELDIKTKDQVEALGIDKFNELCRSKVLIYAEEWKKIVSRTGRWVDMDNAYLTMNPEFMESVWWAFSELYKKGLAYEGHKVMPYCPRCATPLSNMEVGQGYKDRRDKAITVKFEVSNEPGTFFLAWTTTPWTLPGNLALTVGKKIEYSKVKTRSGCYILATDLLNNYSKELGEYETIASYLGKDLVGIKYKPIFDYYKTPQKAFIVIDGDHVTTESGTGIVHTAPAFGEVDYSVAKDHGIDFYMPVDDLGNFTIDVQDYAGKSVISLETNEKIIKDLGDKIFRVEGITHSYPHCWRCDTPLIYKGVSSWFVNIEKIKSRMLENNQAIYWLPSAIGHGRFAKLIENAPDWSVSRNRFWGTPLPIWRCSTCPNVDVIGSISDLKQKSGKDVTDIHLHKINKITWKCTCGGEMKLTGEVFDCWFESGSMPYASIHFPFENDKKFRKNYPADFIAEGIDQTRGWFYSLLALSTALFDEASYKGVITNGTILAESGLKMSKKLQNYPDPMKIIDKYGADAMRFYLMNSPAVHADDFRFSEKGVEEVVKKVILTLWNSYSFYVTYSRIDNFIPSGKLSLEHVMDYWIISELNQLIDKVTISLEEYDIAKAARLLAIFIDDLSNWYIRRSRRRFWKSESDDDKNAAYETLYYVLTEYIKLLAPFMPFITEAIYQNLVCGINSKLPASIHLSDWPISDQSKLDKNVNKQVHLARLVVEKGLKIRAQHGLNVRQPLAAGYIFLAQKVNISAEIKQSIEEELNLHELKVVSVDNSSIKGVTAEKIIKIDFKVAGPRLGKKIKEIQSELLSGHYVENLDGSILVCSERLAPSEVSISIGINSNDSRYDYDSDGSVALVLDTHLEDDLVVEGFVREFIHKIQDSRKKAGFEVEERVILAIEFDKAKNIFDDHWLEYIKKETLSDEIRFNNLENPDYNGKIIIGEYKLNFQLKRK